MKIKSNGGERARFISTHTKIIIIRRKMLIIIPTIILKVNK